MTRKQGALAAVIIVVVLAMAVWSKLRFDREGYDAPQRWKQDEHPAFQQRR